MLGNTMKHFVEDLNDDDIAEVEERENTMVTAEPFLTP